ncbi:MAG: sugar phosphate isomerase/epimerase [Acidobacteria bacterium]|nr:sugar phosphate isomerase/epimerase [Acidobacteriota bacterium]
MRRREFLMLAGALPAAGMRLDGRQLGANTAITGYSFAQAVRLLREIDFPVIEIQAMGVPEATAGAYPGFRFAELSGTQKAAMKGLLKGVPHITSHLPYTGLEYFAKDRALAAAAVRVVDEAIDGSAYFGAEMAVLHPKPGKGFTDEEQWPQMLEQIRKWGDRARKHGMKIALETGYPASVADFVRLIREVDHPFVGATIDVGHQGRYKELVAKIPADKRGTAEGIRAYNDTTLAIIEGLGAKTFHFHIHDIEPETWKEHKPLGTGFVDYERLYGLLGRMGYKGYFIFEIGGDAAKMEGYLRDGKSRMKRWLS